MGAVLQNKKSIIPVLLVLTASLQLWDSNVFHSTPLIIAMVLMAFFAPLVLFVVPYNRMLNIATLSVSILLLILARVFSPVRLIGLITTTFFILLAGTINHCMSVDNDADKHHTKV